MNNFLRYAWSKRAQWWSKRDVAIRLMFRQFVRVQYRLSGILGRIITAGDRDHGGSEILRKATNPFIEYEIGRLGVDPAPIPTTIRESYAQCNEDIIVEALLRARLALTGRHMSSVRYLEIGGNHPVQTSSTYLLYRAWGARGLIVEANSFLADRLRVTRSGDQIVKTAVSDRFDATVSLHVHELDELSSLSRESIRDPSVSGVPGGVARVDLVQNLHINEFFDQYVHDELDFMSIDIEGLDLLVLKALSPAHRPAILQVECVNPELLQEFRSTLEPRGYRIAAITDINVVFVQA